LRLNDLARVRRQALEYLGERELAVLGLTCDLIAAPSPNLPGDETAPAAVIRDAVQALGLPTARVVAMEPHRPNLLITLDSGRPGPRLGICGHLDTKPVGEAAGEWKSDPFTPVIDGDRIYGLGSTDMKGAVAAMVSAAAAVAAAGGPPAGSLTIILTADEEYGSAKGAEYLVRQNALEVDAVVLCEPSGVREDWEAIRIVSRGISCFKVQVHGTQMHSSISDQIPSVNAVEAMAKVLAGLRNELKLTYAEHPLCPGGPTVNIGVRTEGGVGFGVLPGYAEFWSDIRTIPGMTQEQLSEDIEAALSRLESEALGATLTMNFADHLAWLAPTEVPAEHPVVRACQSAATEVIGLAPPLAAFPGASDAWPFQGMGGIPTIAAFGPGLLPLAHGPNEWVSATSVLQAARMYALLALEYCSEPAS
jgi:acetylornithine deacetylase/succinyl-diaminopimelate desuccinylase-like protein